MMEPTVKPELHSLPPETLARICQYLDVKDLMNARLSCKILKDAVETAAVLENYPVEISNRYYLRRLIKCDVPYNNVILNFKFDEVQFDLPELGVKGGSYIRKLQINFNTNEQCTIKLLTACSHLKELDIWVLNSVLYQQDSIVFKKVLKNLASLNKLTMHQIKGREDASEDVYFFIKLLRNCTKLKSVKIPWIQSYNEVLNMRKRFVWVQENENNNDNGEDENFEERENWEDEENWEEEENREEEENWEQEENWEEAANLIPNWGRVDFGDENVDDILVRPMLDYIRFKINQQNEQLFPIVNQIDIKGLHEVEENAFKELLEFCYDNEISLVGVVKRQVPWSKLTLNPKYGEVIKSAEDLLCFPNVFPHIGFQNLTSLSMNMQLSKPPFDDNIDLSFPHLQNLQVIHACGAENEWLIYKLLKDYQRPTVKKLAIEWQVNQRCQAIKGRDLANNYRNLTELSVDGWNAVDSEFCFLWENLLKLEKVSIRCCQNLTNKGFVGNSDLTDLANIDQRPFNRLKELKSLTIFDSMGTINEVALLDCFRWIKLRYFKFATSSEMHQDSYLAFADTPLGNYVHYCFLQMPVRPRSCQTPFRSRWDLSRDFKNLKRPVNWSTW